MKVKVLPTLLIFVLLLGCRTTRLQSPTDSNTIPIREYSVLTVLWQQHAAEYKALSYQAYNIAKWQLDAILSKNNNYEKPLAIITDIDETILDNSPFNGKMIELNEAYTRSRWLEWGKEKKAKAVPGALEFFKYAESKGIEIFYISNRLAAQKNETLENMKLVGFPFSDEAHILLRENTGGKEPRRVQVQDSHEIIMLLGDNLSDFSYVFDNHRTDKRNYKTDSLKAYFGNKFIVLPNPMYGDWETKGILEGNYDWTNFQKDSIRRKKIRSY